MVAFCISPYLVCSVATAACTDSMGHTDIFSYVPTAESMSPVQEEVPSVISTGTIADPTLPWFQVPYAPVSVGPPESPPMTLNSGHSVKTRVTHVVHAPAVVSAAAASAVVVGASATTGTAGPLASSTHMRKTFNSAQQDASHQTATKVVRKKETHTTYQMPHYVYPPGSTAVHYLPPSPLVARPPPYLPTFPPRVRSLQGVAEVTHHLVHVPGHVVLDPAPSVVAVAAPAAVVAAPPPPKPYIKPPAAIPGKMVTLNGYHSNSFIVAHAPTVVQIAPPPVLVKRPPPPKPSPRPVATKATRKVPKKNPSPSPILFLPSPTIINVNVHQAPVIKTDHKAAPTKTPEKVPVKNVTVNVVPPPRFPNTFFRNQVKPMPPPLPVTRAPTLRPTTRPTTKRVTKKVPRRTPPPFVPTTTRRPKVTTLPPPPKTKRPTTPKVTTRPPTTKRTIKVTPKPSTARPTPMSVVKRNITKTPKYVVTRKPITSGLALPPAKIPGSPPIVQVGIQRKSSVHSEGVIEQTNVQRTPTAAQLGITGKGGVQTVMFKETTVQGTPTAVQLGMTGKGGVQTGMLKGTTMQGTPTMVHVGMTRESGIESGGLKTSTLQGSGTIVRMHSPQQGSIRSGILRGSIVNGTVNISGNVTRSSPVMIAQPPTVLSFGRKGSRTNVSAVTVGLPQEPPLLFQHPGGNTATVTTTKFSDAAKPATQVGMNPVRKI